MSVDIARWSQLSPLLDELLDLAGAARAARLQELRAQDAALADELAELLRRDEAMNKGPADFPASPLHRPRATGQAPGQSAGQLIGAYTLVAQIGQGGMGTVWLARRTDGRFEGQVAIKFLTAGLLSQGQGGSRRFEREGQILARLAHPNIARLIDAGVAADGGPPYLVLDYVDGLPLTDYCELHQLDVRARLTLFLDVLGAVAHAHNRLILHRDLKPSNILVSAAGEVKLLDFGIAKLLTDVNATASEDQATVVELTRQVGNAYTPNYAAPEQLQGGEVTTATDVYALGVLLYLLLSGQHPMAAALTAPPLERMRAVIETAPKRLSDQVRAADPKRAREISKLLRGDLDTVVARALKKAPAERYANAAALADDVRRWLAHEPIAARPDSAAYRLAKFVRRHRLGVAAGSMAGLALATSIGVVLWEARRTERQRAQAEGLIEFMLGDLRKKLEPVGRLDVLDSVGEKALTYYAAQPTDQQDPDSLGRRARALHLMGEVAEKRGRLDEAGRMFAEAAQSTAELLARAPRDGQRLFDHAQSVYWVGFIDRRMGQTNAARAQWERYLALAVALRELAPDNIEWQSEEAFAQQNLGVLEFDVGQAEAALRRFQATDGVWQRLVKQRPDLYLELANALGWQALAEMSLGRYKGAIEAELAKVDALDQVPGAATSREVQVLKANAAHNISRSYLYLAQSAAALQWAAQAVGQFETLVALDGANTDWLYQLAIARIAQLEMLASANPSDADRSHLRAVRADLSQLLRADADKLDWNCALRGRLVWLEAKHGRAAAPLQAYVTEMQGLAAGGKTLSVDQARVVAKAELLLGDMLVAANEPSLARTQWQAAAARLKASAEVGEHPSMTLLAQALFVLGATEESHALAERLKASAYRHPDYNELQRLLTSQGRSP